MDFNKTFVDKFDSIGKITAHIKSNKNTPIRIFSDGDIEFLTMEDLNFIFTRFHNALAGGDDLQDVMQELNSAYVLAWQKLTRNDFSQNKKKVCNSSYFSYVIFPFKLVLMFLFRVIIICAYIFIIVCVCYVGFECARRYFNINFIGS